MAFDRRNLDLQLICNFFICETIFGQIDNPNFSTRKM